MGITSQIKFGLARWLLKASSMPTLPTWVRLNHREVINIAAIADAYRRDNGAIEIHFLDGRSRNYFGKQANRLWLLLSGT